MLGSGRFGYNSTGVQKFAITMGTKTREMVDQSFLWRLFPSKHFMQPGTKWSSQSANKCHYSRKIFGCSSSPASLEPDFLQSIKIMVASLILVVYFSLCDFLLVFGV